MSGSARSHLCRMFTATAAKLSYSVGSRISAICFTTLHPKQEEEGKHVVCEERVKKRCGKKKRQQWKEGKKSSKREIGGQKGHKCTVVVVAVHPVVCAPQNARDFGRSVSRRPARTFTRRTCHGSLSMSLLVSAMLSARYTYTQTEVAEKEHERTHSRPRSRGEKKKTGTRKKKKKRDRQTDKRVN